ncbi:MAG: hypothetical protein KTR19_08125 [Hyphomicrobiales bacterium]|nr:hypothetical protein [Hyphomicrobiales bacterium]
MNLRWIAIMLLACCGASLADAGPRNPGVRGNEGPVILAGSVKDYSLRWRHPKDVYEEFSQLDPRDCAHYPAARYPKCAELESGGSDIGAKRYFIDPDNENAPVTRNYPGPRRGYLPVRPGPRHPEFPRTDPVEQQARYLRGMAAQLLLVTFAGSVAPEAGLVRVLRLLRQGEVGGVMVRAENVSSATQLGNLSQMFENQAVRDPLILLERPGASTAGSLPKSGFSAFPSPREVGDKNDALEAFSLYQNMAEELATSGISMNVGPLVDICQPGPSNPDALCYGDEVSHAAAFASAFIFAHHDQQVLSAMRFRPTGASLASVEMLNQVLNRMEPDALFVDLDLANGIVTEDIAEAQKALRQTGYSGVIIHKRSDVLTPAETVEALIATLNSGGDMLLFTPSGDWSAEPFADQLGQAANNERVARFRIRESFENVYRMNWQRRQWKLKNSSASVEANSSIYRRPVR